MAPCGCGVKITCGAENTHTHPHPIPMPRVESGDGASEKFILLGRAREDLHHLGTELEDMPGAMEGGARAARGGSLPGRDRPDVGLVPRAFTSRPPGASACARSSCEPVPASQRRDAGEFLARGRSVTLPTCPCSCPVCQSFAVRYNHTRTRVWVWVSSHLPRSGCLTNSEVFNTALLLSGARAWHGADSMPRPEPCAACRWPDSETICIQWRLPVRAVRSSASSTAPPKIQQTMRPRVRMACPEPARCQSGTIDGP